MTKTNGLTIVLGNASLEESVSGVVSPHGLSKRASDNAERLVEFASTHWMCVMNTLFPHQVYTKQHSIPTRDYVLVKHRLRPWQGRRTG